MSSEAASTEVIQGLQQEVPMPPNSTLNYTRRKLEDLKMLLWQYEHNRSITSAWHYVFLVGYILVGVIAVLANGLVVLAVFRNKNVRTPRNLLIFNLAVTDLALAATIPLSAIDALSKYWPWGNHTDWLCKISKSVPTTLVFMVSVIIIIIAADRYRCIVMRTHTQMTRTVTLFVLPISLGIASTVSMPLLLHSQLVRPPVQPPVSSSLDVVFCMEQWVKSEKIDEKNILHRAMYSVAVAVLQYLLPLLIVLVIYSMIYKYLREQHYPRHLRQNKTNALLMGISLTHCIMWLPFSVFNILADLWPNELFQSNPELMINIYCATHLIGMTSTCTNPILYAFFNENLRREFEFLAEFILPNALYRSQNTSQRSIKSNVGGDAIENGGNRKNPLQNLKPRRATEAVLYGNENQIMESDQLPTVHNESEENKENCDCFIPNAKSGFDNNFEMANF